MEATPVEKVESPAGEAVVRSVLKKIGTPKNIHSAQAVNVYGDFYRVNIRTFDDTGFMKIAKISDTYFVQSSEDGNIKAVYEGKTPIELIRKY
jgi:hypothetical protein